MNRLIKYQKMQIKGAFGCLFRGLLVMAVLFVLLCSVLAASFFIRSRNTGSAAVKVAVVSNGEEEMMNMLISYVGSMSSVKSFCRLDSMNFDEAMEGMENGRVDMVISIPADFYYKANTMQEVSMQIYIPTDSLLAGKRLLAIMDSVERMMITTEAAICTMYDTMTVYDVSMSVSQMEELLFEDIVSQFLNRVELFEVSTLSIFGNYDFVQFYIVSIIQLITILFGVFYIRMYRAEILQLERLLARNSLQRVLMSLIHIVSVTIASGTLLTVVVYASGRFFDMAGAYDYCVLPGGYACLWLYAFMVSAFIHLCACIFGNSGHASSVYILIVLIVAMISGVIVPGVYLPDAIRSSFFVNPLYNWQNFLLHGFWGDGGQKFAVLPIIITTVIMAASAILLYLRRLEKNE